MSSADRISGIRTELLALRKELQQALAAENTRARAPIVRQLHEVLSMLDPASGFASQAGQDRIIAALLKQKRGGTFLDIGAYDGVTGSNTLYFERSLGWTGVLVEPVATQRSKAEATRQSPTLPYAISDRAGQATFIAVEAGFTQMSGLEETYDEQLLARVRSDPRHQENTQMVETRTIADVFGEAGMDGADFVSLDIEGGELAALSVFPFADIRVEFWAIENNTGSGEIAALMRDKGYELVEFCGPDEIYRLP